MSYEVPNDKIGGVSWFTDFIGRFFLVDEEVQDSRRFNICTWSTTLQVNRRPCLWRLSILSNMQQRLTSASAERQLCRASWMLSIQRWLNTAAIYC